MAGGLLCAAKPWSYVEWRHSNGGESSGMTIKWSAVECG